PGTLRHYQRPPLLLRRGSASSSSPVSEYRHHLRRATPWKSSAPPSSPGRESLRGHLAQFFDVQRLFEVKVGPATDRWPGIGLNRNTDNRDMASFLVISKSFDHPITVHPRHDQVHGQHIGMVLTGELNSLAAVVRPDHAVSLSLQDIGDYTRDIFIIIDYQNQ